MESIKIWHTPDENPSVFNVYPILVLYEASDTPEIMSSKDYFQLTHDRYVNRWCYWDEFIKSVDATSKALDVAIDGIKNIGKTIMQREQVMQAAYIRPKSHLILFYQQSVKS